MTAARVRSFAADELRRRDGREIDACASVCGDLIGVIEASFAAQRAAGATVACAPGCTFCCHQRVTVFAHEAIALHMHLRATLSKDAIAEIEARVVENARRVDTLTEHEHRTANLRCALLVDGRCAAYAARPSACARYHSLSRARCEWSFAHPIGIGTPSNSRPALAEVQALGVELDDSSRAALRDTGLAATKGELQQMLRELIEEPTFVARWSRGEDVAALSARKSPREEARRGADTRAGPDVTPS